MLSSIRIVVVLPAPLGPIKPKSLPASMENETLRTTRSPEKAFESPEGCQCFIH